MSHYPFAHRGNAPFSTYQPIPGISVKSRLVFACWSHNAPEITGFTKSERSPSDSPLSGDIANMFHPDYPAPPGTTQITNNEKFQFPGAVYYLYNNTTLPVSGWVISSDGGIFLADSWVVDVTVDKPRRRNTVMEIEVVVNIGATYDFRDSFAPIFYPNSISAGGGITYRRVVTVPTPPTFSRRRHPQYRDYSFELNSDDITFNNLPTVSTNGTVPTAISDLAYEYLGNLQAAVSGWNPIVTFRYFAMPYGVSQSLIYQYTNNGLTRPKVTPGPLF